MAAILTCKRCGKRHHPVFVPGVLAECINMNECMECLNVGMWQRFREWINKFFKK